MEEVGSLDLVDLDALNKLHGGGFLPFPLRFTRPGRFASANEAEAHAASVSDRFRHGDLRTFTQCVTAYSTADIRVECHVQHIPADIPCGRVLAYRAEQLGFLVTQQPEQDVVDVYTVSPYDLGAAIAEAVPLAEPGGHHAIVVPEYAPRTEDVFDSDEFVIGDRRATSTEVLVPAAEVVVYSMIQSHWQPAKKWGRDPSKPALIWVGVDGDGDYVYADDQSHATPMTRRLLRERIDALIADDIEALREYRDY